METAKLKCQICDIIPDKRNVLQCSDKHLMCITCGYENEVCRVSKRIGEKHLKRRPGLVEIDVG